MTSETSSGSCGFYSHLDPPLDTAMFVSFISSATSVLGSVTVSLVNP